MSLRKTLFAQVMDLVPWTSFKRIVDSYGATRACAEQLRAMAFAQLTCCERLRNIEASLAANASKL